MTSVLRQLPLRFRRTFLPLLTVVAMLGSTLGISAAFAGTVSPFAATDGVLDLGVVGPIADSACGSGDDTQPIGGDVKLDDIQDEAPPVIESKTLGAGKSDLCDLWYQTAIDTEGDIWLYLALRRFSAEGTQVTYIELFDVAPSCDVFDIAGCNPFETRDLGSRVVAFDFQGNDSDINAQLRTWDAGTSTFGPLTALGGTVDGRTGNGGLFAELSINLSDAGILPNINEATECSIIAAALPYTVTGNSDQASMIDILLADIEPISNCGTAQIIKKDAEDGNVLTGAQYSVYRDNGTTPGAVDAGDTLIGTCETGSATDPCVFDDLLGGNYLAVETQAPEWYVELIGAAAVKSFTVTIGQTTTITFVNPPIPIRIDVTPETDTNPVGHAHRFTVTIEKDPLADGNWEAAEFDYAADPSDPQPGEFVVNWSGVTATVDLDPDGAANPCIDGTDGNGECVVDVTATTTGNGTLTATLYTPYQHSTTPNPVPNVSVSNGSIYDRIADSGAKFWRGWKVDIDDPATNLLGDAHPFTVTVTEYGPDPQDPQQTSEGPAADVIVVATWDGPTDSTVTGDGTAVPALPAGVNPGGLPTAACTTDASGECDITVDSDTNVGTGTLTVVYLSGAINGEATTMSTFSQQDDVDTTKTWIEYRLWVTPDADINQVDWEHDFDVHVQMNDGSGWADVEGATFTAPSTLTANDGDWSFDDDLGGDLALVDDTCDDGTGSDGVCTITVESPTTGTVILTVTGVTVPFDGGTPLTLSDTALSAGNGVDDNAGEKTWIDYGVTIGDDGTNLLGEPHPFTVAVTRSDIGALEGATVYLTWDGPAGSVIYPAGQPGSPYVDGDAGTDGVQFTCTTDAAGECDVEVDSDSGVGTGTLSVTMVEDNSGDVTDGGSVSFELGEKDTTKTWIAVDLDISDSATNLTGEDHLFTVTATLFDGDPEAGEDLPVTGATLCISIDGTVGSVVGATAGDGDPCALDEYEITSTTDGEFEITVTSDDPGSLTVTLESVHFSYDGDDFSVDLTDGSDGYTPDAESSVEATKTWIAVDLDISGDSTNLVGSEHTFDVTALVFDGDPEAGEDLPVTGATLCISVDGSVGSVVGATAGDGDPCALDEYEITSATDGEFEIVVDSDDPGSLTVTLESVHFSWNGTAFSVDLTSGSDGYQPADGSDTEATKTWISYALAITPQDATNLLPDDPDHPLTVTLSSEGGAPIAEQTLDLTLTSDNGALIIAVDADGDGLLDELDPAATEAECVTDELGQCAVVISADTPGSATLSASFTFTTDDGEHTIESGEFPSELTGDENGQDADKTWTTYVVTVNGPAINLLGSPHTFTVHVQQTFDGENFTDIEGAVFGTSAEDGSYITISDISASGDVASITGGTCFDEPGTDADGECTVIVESTATTIATVTAYFEGTASDSQSSLFYDENTKQWIDYRLDVTPDTADNLVDTDHVFTVTVEVDLGDGEGWQAVPDGSEVALALTGVGTIISTGDGGTIDEDGMGGTCVTDGGTCEVTIRSADAGQSSLVATYTGIAEDGDLINVEESADFSNADSPALKNWVDYELVMDEDAVNPIGTTHTFTATLTVDTGEGFGPAAGEEVDFTISGVGTVVEVENGTVDEDARGGTCETDEDGTCYIIIASNEVGATTVTATYGAVVGETSRDFSDSAVKTWVSNPAIDLVKDVDKTTAGIGELVTYTYTITNTGDVTLTNVQLIDEVTITGAFDQLLELIGAAGAITLEPGESTSLTSTHLVTEADLPGPIDNVATVTGEAPDGTEVSDTDDETVDPFGLPAISLNKEADLPGDDGGIKSVGVDPDDPGATVIEYGFVIVNEGNVTLTDVTLQDFVLSELPSGGGTLTFDNATSTVDGDLLSVTIADTTLSPGESTTGTLLFAVRSGDVDLGLITNVAEVTGTAPDDTTVSDEDIENVALVLPDVVPPPPAPTPVLPKTGAEFTDILLWALLTAGLGFALLLIQPPGRLAPRRRKD